jgi:uncharacterized membrane protein YphA (DoxX/SURF4 family)
MNRSLETLRDTTARPDIGYDLIRMFLGVALFIRGALFVANPSRISDMTERTGGWFVPAALGHYIGIAHLSGGLLLAVGLATRFAAAIQLPVLIGAVFLVHWSQGLLSSGQSLELASLVLVMLLVYAACGSGRLSFDYLVHKSEAHPAPPYRRARGN